MLEFFQHKYTIIKKGSQTTFIQQTNTTITKFIASVHILCFFFLFFSSRVIYRLLLLFLQTAGGLEETLFKSLDDLIRHYKKKNQGLAMHLRHSVKRKTALLIQPRHAPVPEGGAWGASMPPPEEDHDYESASGFISFTTSSMTHRSSDLFSVFSFRRSWLWIRRSLTSMNSFVMKRQTHEQREDKDRLEYGRQVHRLNQIQDY